MSIKAEVHIEMNDGSIKRIEKSFDTHEAARIWLFKMWENPRFIWGGTPTFGIA